MNHVRSDANASPLSTEARRLASALCRIWLAAGVLSLAVSPSARAVDPMLGWLPFWLLLAPLLVLAQIEVLDGFRRSASALARSRRVLRRRARRGGQARRIAREAA
jgi:hypothetical protein